MSDKNARTMNYTNEVMKYIAHTRQNLHIAKIGNVDNVIRDCEGDIIQDNSVVEFYYNKDSDIPLDFRWIPLRTRHDKIDSINKFKRKYGNNSNIANFILFYF